MPAPSLAELRTLPPSDGEPAGLRISSEWVLREVARSVAGAAPPADRYGRVASILKRASGAWDLRVCRVDGDWLRPVATGRGPLEAAVLVADTPVARSVAGQPVWEVASAGAASPSVRTLVGGPVGGMLALPCLAEGELVGVVEVLPTSTLPPGAAVTAQLAAATDIVAVALRGDRERAERLRAETARLEEARAREEERRRLEEQLVHAARLVGVGEATASIVHDLAQPLVVLQSWIDVLEQDPSDTATAARALPVMARSTQRIVDLVRHLRDYARAGPNPHEPVDLSELVGRARELWGGERGEVSVTTEPGVVVRGDGAKLEQVLVNLVSNARAAGGPVEVRVRRGREGQAVVEVRDHGPGVPPELRALVFEPFFTTRPRGQGTGLGLAICARIAQEHGGTVDVDDAPGGGARFRVVLPAL